jgi:hypothetical protein
VTELNSITLKRSRSVSVSSANATDCFACSMDAPAIEPDVSTMITISRGTRWNAAFSCALACGGTTITRPYSASATRCVNTAACGSPPPASRHLSSKSRLAASWDCERYTDVLLPADFSTMASWYELTTPAIGTPASIVTAMSTGLTSAPAVSTA